MNKLNLSNILHTIDNLLLSFLVILPILSYASETQNLKIISIPSGLKVFISPINSDNLTDNKFLKGVTPLTIELSKGNYNIVLMAPLENWEGMEKFHTEGFAKSFQITKEEQETGIKFFKELNNLFENDGNVKDDDAPMELKCTIGGSPVKQKYVVKEIGKIYDIEIPSKKQTIISLFQRKDQSVEDLLKYIPQSNNFNFDEDLLLKIFGYLKIPNDKKSIIKKILHKSGKLVLWTDDIDKNYFEENNIPISILNLGGYKKYKIIIVVLDNGEFELNISFHKSL